MFPRSFLLTIALVLGFLSGCSTAPKPAPVSAAAGSLTDLIVARLEVAREVAWIKFVNHTPVRDPQRETELINRRVAEGAKLGLPPATVSAFFRAQIDASCQVQQESIRYWQRGGTLPAYAPRDLKRDIRPRLDEIGAKLLRELARTEHSGGALHFKSYAYQTIRLKGFSWRTAKIAVAPLN